MLFYILLIHYGFISDLLDYNNNKKAIQEADRVLKKSPDLDCAKVLKSLALLRLGRDYEAEQLLDIVAKRAPCDDATLQAMTICYRELRARMFVNFSLYII